MSAPIYPRVEIPHAITVKKFRVIGDDATFLCLLDMMASLTELESLIPKCHIDSINELHKLLIFASISSHTNTDFLSMLDSEYTSKTKIEKIGKCMSYCLKKITARDGSLLPPTEMRNKLAMAYILARTFYHFTHEFVGYHIAPIQSSYHHMIFALEEDSINHINPMYVFSTEGDEKMLTIDFSKINQTADNILML